MIRLVKVNRRRARLLCQGRFPTAANCISPHPPRSRLCVSLTCSAAPSLAAIQRPLPALLCPAEFSLVSAVSLRAESGVPFTFTSFLVSCSHILTDVPVLPRGSGERDAGTDFLCSPGTHLHLFYDWGQTSVSLALTPPSVKR